MEKRLNFNFFQVVMPDVEPRTFETVIDEITALGGAAATYDNGEYHVRLLGVRQQHGYYLGDIARIRMNDIPDKMRLSGEREALNLEDDQGLGEIASFIYNTQLKVLVLMRNRFAVTASGFANYVQNLGRVQGVIIFEHILEADAYQRLARMSIAHKVELGIAAPGNGAIFDELGLRPQTLAELINAAPKVRMDFAISMDRDRSGSLPIRALQNMITTFRRDHAGELVSLIVSGKENPEQRLDIVDMLEEVMTDKEPVILQRNQRTIADHQRHFAVEQVYQRKLPVLNRILREA